VPVPHLRPGARAVILDQDDRVLLCRLAIPRLGETVVIWTAPGGGVEPGETLHAALRRELLEEVGLRLDSDPPHVWHQEVVAAGHVPGYDGLVNDYFLVRTIGFTPRGTMTDAELAAENMTGSRWWSLAEIAGYPGPDLFGPRDLATPLAALISGGPPAEPVRLSL
jgi:8-oxo-dGTP diphosphatase